MKKSTGLKDCEGTEVYEYDFLELLDIETGQPYAIELLLFRQDGFVLTRDFKTFENIDEQTLQLCRVVRNKSERRNN